jgi:hypothetical protein
MCHLHSIIFHNIEKIYNFGYNFIFEYGRQVSAFLWATKALRSSRGSSTLFLDLGTRKG